MPFFCARQSRQANARAKKADEHHRDNRTSDGISASGRALPGEGIVTSFNTLTQRWDEFVEPPNAVTTIPLRDKQVFVTTRKA